GYILVRGPTPKTVKVVPPATVTIDGLQPGSYTVSLEGFANDVVDRFFPPTNVIVAMGQNASVTVTAAQFASFVPSQVTAPSSISGKTFRVSYEAVGGAMRYEAQAASEQSFATIKGTGEATPPQTSVDVTVPDYGTYYVRMRAVDPYQSKGGWATPPGSITLTPPPQADLIVESLTHTPASPTTRDAIRFTAVVKNAGTASAGASTLELRVGGETPGASSTQLAVPVLAPGATYTAERQLQLAAGPYRTTATADVANVVTESDETNNVKTDDYTVTTALRADLVITTPVTVTPTSVTPGGTVTLSNYTVANQGAAGSNAFRLGY